MQVSSAMFATLIGLWAASIAWRRGAQALFVLARSWGTAILVGIAVALFFIFGSELFVEPRFSLHLDMEQNLATAFSVGLMLAASSAAASLGIVARHDRRFGRSVIIATWALSIILLILALDDWFGWHERLEGVGGLSWTIWYAPLPGLAVLAGIVVGRHLPLRSRVYLVLGFLAWLAAAAIETFFWGPPDRDFQSPVTMPIEEILEMVAPIALFAGISRGVVDATASKRRERQSINYGRSDREDLAG